MASQSGLRTCERGRRAGWRGLKDSRRGLRAGQRGLRTSQWGDGRTNGQTDGRNFTPFYRTSAPAGAAAQKPS